MADLINLPEFDPEKAQKDLKTRKAKIRMFRDMVLPKLRIILLLIPFQILLSEAVSAPKRKTPNPEVVKAKEAKLLRRVVDKHIVIKYDRFKGYFTVGFPSKSRSSSTFILRSPFGADWQMGIRGFVTIVPQKGLETERSRVNLTFVSTSKSWRFLKHHSFDLLLDGEAFSIGKLSHDGNVGGGYGVVEYMGISMSLEDFKKIINSELVEGRIGNTEFKLKPRLLAFLRVFAEKISYPKKLIEESAHLVP